MAMARIPFETGCYYHLYNRGTERRDIFVDDVDRFRFVHYLYESNSSGPMSKLLEPNYRGRTSVIRNRRGEPIVEILAWCLMPNHYHLLVRQLVARGISRFLQKLGTGYTMFFNTRHERSGVLFQGKTKAKWVNEEAYLTRMAAYIHANPAELYDGGVRKRREALHDYRWSSHHDYFGKKNFPSIISKGTLLSEVGEASEQEHFLLEAIALQELDWEADPLHEEGFLITEVRPR